MDKVIYIAQALSIIFSWALAKMQGPAVGLIEDRGAPEQVYKALHTYGFGAKVIFLFSIDRWIWSFYHFSPGAIVKGVAIMIICGLWIGLTFDPFLNKARTIGLTRPWYYISINDADGRRWTRILGKNPGKKKAVILLVMIIILNLLFKLFL